MTNYNLQIPSINTLMDAWRKRAINQHLKKHGFRLTLDELYERHCNGKDNKKLVKLLKDLDYTSKNPWMLRFETPNDAFYLYDTAYRNFYGN